MSEHGHTAAGIDHWQGDIARARPACRCRHAEAASTAPKSTVRRRGRRAARACWRKRSPWKPAGAMAKRLARAAVCLALIGAMVCFGPMAHAGQADQAEATGTVGAEELPASTDQAPSTSPRSFWEIVTAGGPVGYVIMLLSVAGAALVIEHLLTIRASVLMPPELASRVHELLKQGNVAQAEQQCKLQPSFLAYVLHAGISEIEGGYDAIEKAIEDATAEQAARLFRKIEYLSVIGNIAPMLGLLGTVIGMIFAFQEVANTQGAARAADLAEGIYLALVTTVEGLLVAIPSLAAFAVFRNRVDQLVAEAAYAAQHTFTPLKRRQRRVVSPPPPPTAEAASRKGGG